MSSQTTERVFEFHVEDLLLKQGGWLPGTNAEWDKARALFPARVFAFIKATQPKLWAEMAVQHGSNLQPMLLDALGKELDIKGSLHVLRHGFKFYGKLFRLAYFKPAHALSPDVLALYDAADDPAKVNAAVFSLAGQGLRVLAACARPAEYNAETVLRFDGETFREVP